MIKNILVLSGGPSVEHEISLKSGVEVAKNLDQKKYHVTSVVIPKRISPSSIFSLDKLKKKNMVDLCFIALHGAFGEDGRIQAILDFLDIPYTGSGVLASALGMDKIRSRQIFSHIGLLVPKTQVVKRDQKYDFDKTKYPVVAKPYDQGSSIGVFIVHNQKELRKAFVKIFNMSEYILIEEYVKGTEVTCAVLGNKKPFALPVVEIVPKKEFFDFEAKYNESKCDEIVPARISKKLTQEVQEAAIKAFQALGCKGFARIDMIIRDGKAYILELNTIPGLTDVSLLPKAAKAAGISFPGLLDKIIEHSLTS
jgi:D-alanine-D-alanine ligase